ncbi:MAG TPA: M1 family metallopeptidase, partial [bacterium]|nr:M1 family metallopeptidase [bacterium]
IGLIVGYVYVRHGGFFKYPSGGVLSTHQARYDVKSYDITLGVDPEEKFIRGTTTIKIESRADGLDTIQLNLIGLYDVLHVTGPSQPRFTQQEDTLWVIMNQKLDSGSLADIGISYQGTPPTALYPPWFGGFNWSKDESGHHWIGLSCQGEGGKIWFPCKDHPSDEPDSVALHITVPQPYVVAANGILKNITTTSHGMHTYHWVTRYPINNYDINLSIGRYDIVERSYAAASGQTMPVQFYVLPQDRAKADTLIDMAVDMLSTYRLYFGEYPFLSEKFGLVQTDYLGMEHQTINAYGNNFEYREFAGHRWDELMLHEMGHEWWGNKVTVNDWADFWIHEGICSYGEALYQLSQTGEAGYHNHMSRLRKRIRNKKPLVVHPNATTSEAYNDDIYSKGAYLMHSLRFMLGDSVFFKKLYRFANDSAYTYQNRVNTNDFVRLWADVEDGNTTLFIREFIYTTNLPEITIDSTAAETYVIRSRNPKYAMPLEIQTSRGLERITVHTEGTRIQSGTTPVVDPRRWYLLKSEK